MSCSPNREAISALNPRFRSDWVCQTIDLDDIFEEDPFDKAPWLWGLFRTFLSRTSIQRYCSSTNAY